MGTSSPNTASQLLMMGHEALAYVRDCSADPGRLGDILGGRLDDDNSEILVPPIHDIFGTSEDAEEFVTRLRRLGFRVSCTFEGTFIGWKEEVTLPTARQAAEVTADAFQPLVSRCIRDIRGSIEYYAQEYKFELYSEAINRCPEPVQAEVIIFLMNLGYKVDKHPINIGHTISWYPAHVVRGIKPLPWWKFFRSSK